MKSNKEIIEYYDNCEIDYEIAWDLSKSYSMHYGFWDKDTKTFREALQNTNKELAKLAKINKNKKILDAGCGVGGSAIYLAKNFGCKVIGINLSEHQVKRAKENSKKEGVNELVRFGVGDFTKTKFPSNYFDVVWAIESVCYANDKSKLLKEAHRILKKNGVLVLADIFRASLLPNKHQEKILRIWEDSWIIPSFEEVKTFLNSAKAVGFKNIFYKNATEMINKSAKRLYFAFFPGLIVNNMSELFKIRNKIQSKNAWSAYLQYKSLKEGLWEYGIFYAKK